MEQIAPILCHYLGYIDLVRLSSVSKKIRTAIMRFYTELATNVHLLKFGDSPLAAHSYYLQHNIKIWDRIVNENATFVARKYYSLLSKGYILKSINYEVYITIKDLISEAQLEEFRRQILYTPVIPERDDNIAAELIAEDDLWRVGRMCNQRLPKTAHKLLQMTDEFYLYYIYSLSLDEIKCFPLSRGRLEGFSLHFHIIDKKVAHYLLENEIITLTDYDYFNLLETYRMDEPLVKLLMKRFEFTFEELVITNTVKYSKYHLLSTKEIVAKLDFSTGILDKCTSTTSNKYSFWPYKSDIIHYFRELYENSDRMEFDTKLVKFGNSYISTLIECANQEDLDWIFSTFTINFKNDYYIHIQHAKEILCIASRLFDRKYIKELKEMALVLSERDGWNDSTEWGKELYKDLSD